LGVSSIDPPHGVLHGKIVGCVFRPKNFVESIVMRWSAVPLIRGVLARQGISGNPAATLRKLKRFTAYETIPV
jgi:hypothetical protein